MKISTQEKLELMKSGKLTAKENIQNFLKKIEKENKEINAIIEVNKNAVKEAEAVSLGPLPPGHDAAVVGVVGEPAGLVEVRVFAAAELLDKGFRTVAGEEEDAEIILTPIQHGDGRLHRAVAEGGLHGRVVNHVPALACEREEVAQPLVHG